MNASQLAGKQDSHLNNFTLSTRLETKRSGLFQRGGQDAMSEHTIIKARLLPDDSLPFRTKSSDVVLVGHSIAQIHFNVPCPPRRHTGSEEIVIFCPEWTVQCQGECD